MPAPLPAAPKQLSIEDIQDIQEAYHELVARGDPRAAKVAAFLSTQVGAPQPGMHVPPIYKLTPRSGMEKLADKFPGTTEYARKTVEGIKQIPQQFGNEHFTGDSLPVAHPEATDVLTRLAKLGTDLPIIHQILQSTLGHDPAGAMADLTTTALTPTVTGAVEGSGAGGPSLQSPITKGTPRWSGGGMSLPPMVEKFLPLKFKAALSLFNGPKEATAKTWQTQPVFGWKMGEPIPLDQPGATHTEVPDFTSTPPPPGYGGRRTPPPPQPRPTRTGPIWEGITEPTPRTDLGEVTGIPPTVTRRTPPPPKAEVKPLPEPLWKGLVTKSEPEPLPDVTGIPPTTMRRTPPPPATESPTRTPIWQGVTEKTPRTDLGEVVPITPPAKVAPAEAKPTVTAPALDETAMTKEELETQAWRKYNAEIHSQGGQIAIKGRPDLDIPDSPAGQRLPPGATSKVINNLWGKPKVSSGHMDWLNNWVQTKGAWPTKADVPTNLR